MSFMRIGHGYDVHAFGFNRKLILCGIEIPYEKGLLGHSDADVATHALMDSILGALGKGDIGHLFPDSDDTYLGISSILLLDQVVLLMEQSKYTISNVDMTIICEEPKLAKYMEQMKDLLSTHLHCSKDQLNIKATTEEHLGFTGRKEGIATHVVCLLERIL